MGNNDNVIIPFQTKRILLLNIYFPLIANTNRKKVDYQDRKQKAVESVITKPEYNDICLITII